MSRPLALVSLAALLLAGCAAPPPAQTPATEPRTRVLRVCDCEQLHDWLALHREVTGLSIEDVAGRLAELGTPSGSDQLFYFGLLSQRLDVYTSWIEARDTFRGLANDEALEDEQRQLATIFERYNQSRINWYVQRQKLEQDIELLNQKIEAITEVESSMSTRKE